MPPSSLLPSPLPSPWWGDRFKLHCLKWFDVALINLLCMYMYIAFSHTHIHTRAAYTHTHLIATLVFARMYVRACVCVCVHTLDSNTHPRTSYPEKLLRCYASFVDSVVLPGNRPRTLSDNILSKLFAYLEVPSVTNTPNTGHMYLYALLI